MSKHNRYLPAALRHDNRLINAAARSRKYKRPNARRRASSPQLPLFPVKIRANIRN
jgi:hypothetical protein